MKRSQRQLALLVLALLPFCARAQAPGVIEAEDFDSGSYFDRIAGNQGDCNYRTGEAVDIFVSNDPQGGGCIVKNFETGEWLAYTINVPALGNYDIDLRVSTQFDFPDSAFHIEVDGADVTGKVVLPDTGGWDNYQWLGQRRVILSAGTHVLKIVSEKQYFSFNSIRIADAPDPAPHSAPIPIPSTWEAEDFDDGGQDVAYHDNVAGNQGDCQYRTDEDADIFVSIDAEGGGCIVKNFETGEWLAYTVSVASSGWYDIELRAATNFDFPDSAFHLEVDGGSATGTVVLPNTGGWGNYQWIGKRTLVLNAGTHVLKIVSDRQYFSLNRIRVTASPSPTTSLRFRSGFESATAVDPPTDCYGSGCWQSLSGTDTATGYAWPPQIWQGSNGRFQLHADTVVPVSPNPGGLNSIYDYMVNQIQSGTVRSGTKALHGEIKKSGCCWTGPQGGGSTQDPYVIEPLVEPSGQAGDQYMSYWLKFQPNLEALMDYGDCSQNLNLARQWRTVFEFKTKGDYRVQLQVQKDRNTQPLPQDPEACGFFTPLYWAFGGDNNANSNLYPCPPPGEQNCPPPLVNAWTGANRSVAVPVGQWFKLEVFWHRSSGSDGRVWMAANGRVIVDHYGPNTGDWNAEINRIMVTLLYTSTSYPIYQWVDDLQIWSGFPAPVASDPWYDPPYAAH